MPAFAPLRPTVGLARTAASAARTFSSSASRSIARMFITGRLATEPELMTTSTGREIIKYAVGTNYGPRDNQKTSWFRVGAFVPEGPQRDYILNLPKGTLVFVEGDASMRAYEVGEGEKHYALNIAQRAIEVLRRPANVPPSEGGQL